MPISKFNLEVQNIYIKPLFKPANTFNKPCFETACLGVNVKYLRKRKVAQTVTKYFGYFIFSKNSSELLKVAKLVFRSPCLVTLMQASATKITEVKLF